MVISRYWTRNGTIVINGRWKSISGFLNSADLSFRYRAFRVRERQADRKAFDGKLEFDITLIAHEGDDSWWNQPSKILRKHLTGKGAAARPIAIIAAIAMRRGRFLPRAACYNEHYEVRTRTNIRIYTNIRTT